MAWRHFCLQLRLAGDTMAETSHVPTLPRFTGVWQHGRHRRAGKATRPHCRQLGYGYAYFDIGLHIVNYEQQGDSRAEYGKGLLKDLSALLTSRFGPGWGYATLNNIRQFFLVYAQNSNPVIQSKQLPANHLDNGSSLPGEFSKLCLENSVTRVFSLSWSHDMVLIRIKDNAARSFYEIEAARQDWSVRQLQRQVNSCLYEHLALSRDKEAVLALANEGLTISKPGDIIKDPVTLEFLGLKPEEAFTESKLESAIITRMQDFLLELGKGFLFEARQKRFSFNEEHFFVDLVFYNRLLQCYCLIDLKTDKLTHQDLGQMQMYVNYFDRFVRQPFENPTIGILLCKEKNNALVELTLPADANIYASSYELYLPDKELLQAKVREWIAEFEDNETE